MTRADFVRLFILPFVFEFLIIIKTALELLALLGIVSIVIIILAKIVQ